LLAVTLTFCSSHSVNSILSVVVLNYILLLLLLWTVNS